ncbi:hypothetical protein AB0O76_27235 [Streptomyces sp. NPDC086554]
MVTQATTDTTADTTTDPTTVTTAEQDGTQSRLPGSGIPGRPIGKNYSR